MRPILVIPGVLILLMGVVFALQGAGVLPSTFMIGPVWIAIGWGVALIGMGLTAIGVRTG